MREETIEERMMDQIVAERAMIAIKLLNPSSEDIAKLTGLSVKMIDILKMCKNEKEEALKDDIDLYQIAYKDGYESALKDNKIRAAKRRE